METVQKVGLIAGGGALPVEVQAGAKSMHIPVYIARLKGFAVASDFAGVTDEFALGEFGAMIKALKRQKCSHISFAGTVSKPDFKTIKPDLMGMKFLPGVIKAATNGDDALLRHLMSIFEKQGFKVVAPQVLCAGALIEAGSLGAVNPKEEHRADIDKALEAAKDIGERGLGQGAVACRGHVLAVEGEEGTDAMLLEVSQLDPKLRGTDEKRAGVLAKRLKPHQETRIDLPTIGPRTVENAAEAGLAGIVLIAGRGFVLDKSNVVARADELGLFIYGHEPQDG